MSSKKFLVVHRSAPSAGGGASRPKPSPEEMQAAMAEWQAWKTRFDAELADMGAKLRPEGAVFRDGTVTDGPYAEGKEVLGGYMILQTTSLERATEIVRQMPMQPGAVLEIREIAPF